MDLLFRGLDGQKGLIEVFTKSSACRPVIMLFSMIDPFLE